MARARSGRGDEARLKAKGVVATFQIGGVDFVLVSKADYLSKQLSSGTATCTRC